MLWNVLFYAILTFARRMCIDWLSLKNCQMWLHVEEDVDMETVHPDRFFIDFHSHSSQMLDDTLKSAVTSPTQIILNF